MGKIELSNVSAHFLVPLGILQGPVAILGLVCEKGLCC